MEDYSSDIAEDSSIIEDLASRLRFEFAEGSIWLGEDRLILMHMRAFASLRKELVDTLGAARARGLLTRMGYAAGVSDAELIQKMYPAASSLEKMQKARVLHTLLGFVKADVVRAHMDVAKGEFYAETLWSKSFEKEAHRQIFGVEPGPTGWMQMGYVTGVISKIMGKTVLFTEAEDESGRTLLIGKPIQDWPPAEADELLKYLHPDAISDQILELQQQVDRLRYSIKDAMDSTDLVGRSPVFRSALSLIQRAASSKVTVLLLGETGVGKEVFARALHKASSRASAAFVAVNCGALPEQLIESELFGVEQGAYTGARDSRPGRFERAHGGTLFLDEVSELSLSSQTKLLRVLQEGEVERLGDTKTRKIDVRVIASTNVDLAEAVRRGSFRQDLYYRLNILPVRIPPLRERLEDIPLLAERFIQKYSAREGKSVVKLTDRALHALMKYAWPGNVRELENMIERGVLLAQNGARIDVSNLFLSLPESDPDVQEVSVNKHGKLATQEDGLLRNFVNHFVAKRIDLKGLETLLTDAVLEKADGNVTSAAKALGITRAQLRYRLKQRSKIPPD